MLLSLALTAVTLGLLKETTAQECVQKKVVCYYGSWVSHREGTTQGAFFIENMPVHMCTHLIYAFVGLHPNGNVKIIDPNTDFAEDGGRDALRRFVGLKEFYPRVKVMVAVGGAAEGSEGFSQVVRNPTTRQNAVSSLLEFVSKHNFDGLDLHWVFPTLGDGALPDDKENFVTFLSELRDEIPADRLLLSATMSAHVDMLDEIYNIADMQSHLDFINLMTYDYSHFEMDSVTSFNAPLFSPTNSSCVASSVQAWIERGAPPSKLVLGVPLYGESFTLADPANNQLNAPVKGLGIPGIYSQIEGMLDYTEICEQQQFGDWVVITDPDRMASFTVSGDQWVSYETLDSVIAKGRYARQQGLAGVMLWSIESDDTHGMCGPGPFPLLFHLREGLLNC